MIDDVLEFTGELLFEWVAGRRDERARRQRLALVLGLLLTGVGAVVAVLETPIVGAAIAIVGGALFFYGV